jgi:Flp pilus assembly protein TadD
MEVNEQFDLPQQALTQRSETLCQLGDCHASLSQYQQAQEHYEQAANLSPDDAGPYIGLGVIAMQQGKLDDARIAFQVARRLDNKCAKAYCGLAMIFQQQQDFARAFEHYLKCLEFDGDNMTALLGLFQTSCQMGSFGKIIHYLEIYLNTHPADATVMFCLAALYDKEGKFAEARKLLIDVLAINPQNNDAANLLEEVEHKLLNAGRMGVPLNA